MCDAKGSVGQPLCQGKARGTKEDSDTKPRIYCVCVCVCVCACTCVCACVCVWEEKGEFNSVTHMHASHLKQENLKYTCNRTIMIIHIKCHLSWYSVCDSELPLSVPLSPARLLVKILSGLWQFRFLLTPIIVMFACTCAVMDEQYLFMWILEDIFNLCVQTDWAAAMNNFASTKGYISSVNWSTFVKNRFYTVFDLDFWVITW